MFKWLGGLIDSNEKELKRLQPKVAKINELEPEFERLSDAELRAKTDEFKARLAEATANIQQRLTETQRELEEAKQRLAKAQKEYEQEESTRCKHLQDRIDQLEKERQEVENKVLNELLPEAFAAVRESAKRTIGQRHFDVQLMGGIVLHQGKIAEMKTGEGKTLVATLALYLNSLIGQGCHLVTVNDYLARRDPYWMGPIYHALGVSVASIYPQQTPDEHTPSRLYDIGFDSGDKRWPHFRPVSRREAYEADITYGTSSEFGFDYLRDNMTIDLSHCVQRELNYAIVDEVDNLLIDEARTPLIISAPDVEAGQKYQIFARLVLRLQREKDYEVKEKERSVEPTDDGYANVERILRREGILKSPNLYDPANVDLHRHLRNALNAKELYKRDQQYMVKDGQVIIVDEFTGRLMLGRRYSEGLHQAIEAKEGVKVQQESKTYGTVTIQNYFRMYQKLAGMTGTALTEAEEFHKIYNLEVMVIPTNKPMIREDFQDQIYKDEEAKFRAVVREIEQLHKQERPVLIGTTSIEKSEYLSELLKRKGIPHEVLNAKEHTKEAEIIRKAGEPGAVTVATNMAGRGVDIILGGSLDGQSEPEWQERHNRIVELGGLHIVGTERHEARRIDNQLRGRAGRQGDPGSSRFYVSLEDDIVRRFGGDRIKTFMEWTGMDEDTPIENALVNRTIADVQKRVEGYHFDMRKHLVEYDDVINQQRELIYGERKKILSSADLKANILSMVGEELELENLLASRFEAIGKQGLKTFIESISTILSPPARFDVDAIWETDAQSDFKRQLIECAKDLRKKWDKEIESNGERKNDVLRLIREFVTPHLVAEVSTIFPLPPTLNADALSQIKPKEIEQRLIEQSEALYEEREKEIGADIMRDIEKRVMLHFSDTLWVEHLTMMENMRQEVGPYAMGRQRDPLVIYKNEGYKQFQVLLSTIQHDVTHTIYHFVKREAPQPAPVPAQVGTGGKKQRLKVSGKKIGRNDPCPCGSGKKYKHCCGR